MPTKSTFEFGKSNKITYFKFCDIYKSAVGTGEEDGNYIMLFRTYFTSASRTNLI